ncbi:MAG: flagellar hook-associated protein 3 [Isosphaera sp.]|nr:flagellar hook-associated protein 3 [Isosphaera sp.]
MNIRVTTQTQTAAAMANLQRQSSALAKFQQQLSSGQRVVLPSDDPAAFPALTLARVNSDRLATYAQTVSDATTVLNTGVSALQEVNDTLVRAKQLALEGANATTEGAAAGYEALAAEVDGLIDRAVRAANVEVDGQRLFGGTAAGTTPFRAVTDAQGNVTGVAYDGTADRSRVLIGPGQTVDTRYAGSAVFQRPGADVFQALIQLRDDLRNTTLTQSQKAAALNGRVAGLDAAREAVSEATAEQASALAQLEAVQARVADLKLTADIRIGEVGATDFAEAVVKLKEQETVFQAALAVSANILQPSLLDFIR